MPSLREHCKRTLALYGVDGKEIHQWLDKPVKIMGSSHRDFRHDSDSIKLAGKVFGQKYGVRLTETIALDHIMADHAKEIIDSELKTAFPTKPKMVPIVAESIIMPIETVIPVTNQVDFPKPELITLKHLKELYEMVHKFEKQANNEKAFLEKFGKEETWLGQFKLQPCGKEA